MAKSRAATRERDASAQSAPKRERGEAHAFLEAFYGLMTMFVARYHGMRLSQLPLKHLGSFPPAVPKASPSHQ
jgi:hypothetical protein